jgi:hypothetical protein
VDGDGKVAAPGAARWLAAVEAVAVFMVAFFGEHAPNPPMSIVRNQRDTPRDLARR